MLLPFKRDLFENLELKKFTELNDVANTCVGRDASWTNRVQLFITPRCKQ